MSTPAFVIARDIHTWLVRTVTALEKVTDEIYIVDNDSTWPPLLAWYETTPHTVIRLGRNLGKRGPWQAGIVEQYAHGRRFLLTDPDIVPYDTCPADWLDRFHRCLDEHPNLVKVGFGLPTDDIPARYEHRAMAVRRQAQHFDPKRRHPYGFLTPLDTTLALYREGAPYCTAPAVRTSAPYVARHLAWYTNSKRPGLELDHYRSRVSPKFGHWAKRSLPSRITANPDRRLGGIKPRRKR